MYRYAALLVWFLLALGLLVLPSAAQPPAPTATKILEAFSVRNVGPANMSGRIVDLDVVASNPNVQFVATASGGLWKTTDDGKSWTPVFDGQPTQNLGAVAVAPSNPNIVWVGTGEANPRNSVAWGDGVYKSIDGGATWQNMGLKDTQHIGRVVIHPQNPDIVYVAALGHIWGPNRDRGVFKTTNGGKSWSHVLFLDEQTGCIDLTIDPKEPEILYTAAYCCRRDTFSGGNPATQFGPKAGLYRTADGGKTWEKMTEGLPKFPIGRAGISVYAKDSRIVYAVVQTTRTTSDNIGQLPNQKVRTPGKKKGAEDEEEGGDAKKDCGDLVESAAEPQKEGGDPKKEGGDPKKEGGDKKKEGEPKPGVPAKIGDPITPEDGGIFRSEDKGKTWTQVNSLCPRPFYYGQIRVDPSNDQRIYVLGVQAFASSDGGKQFATTAKGTHADHHALWINPANGNHLILGGDGGLYYSRDMGASFTAQRGMAIGQFYAIAVDMRKPYRVYGGLQDNGSWGGPTATDSADGIAIKDWYNVGGGDGFYCACDPTDANIVYSESQYGKPRRVDLTQKAAGKKGGGGGGKAITPGGKGGGYRFNWSSPFFLSPHDSKTIYYGGNVLFKSVNRGDAWKVISPDLTRNQKTPNGHTLCTLAESPRKAGILWTGSDDGKLHVSRDDGGTWIDLSDKLPGPKARWITRVEPSAHAEGTCYVSYSRYRNDDRQPYLYKTTDFGETWQSLVNNMPGNTAIHVVKESSRNPNLLFVGVEHGVFVSLNGGNYWRRFGQGMPNVAVHDLVIHPRERDLVIATHGRSIYVVDIGPLEEWGSPKVAAANEHLFAVRPALSFAVKATKGPSRDYRAPNPDYGATIWTQFKESTATASLAILDAKKEVIATLPVPKAAGLQSVVWNLTKADSKEQVPAGDYTVRLQVGERTFLQPLRIEAADRIAAEEE